MSNQFDKPKLQIGDQYIIDRDTGITKAGSVVEVIASEDVIPPHDKYWVRFRDVRGNTMYDIITRGREPDILNGSSNKRRGDLR